MPSACRLIVRAKLWNLQFRYLVTRESCTNAKAKYSSSVVPPDSSVHFYHCLSTTGNRAYFVFWPTRFFCFSCFSLLAWFYNAYHYQSGFKFWEHIQILLQILSVQYTKTRESSQYVTNGLIEPMSISGCEVTDESHRLGLRYEIRDVILTCPRKLT